MNPDVTKAMQRVPRGEFLPPELKHLAGKDSPLPIGEDQTISQPSLVARMTEELHLHSGSRVLEIGTGCGFQTAVLAELAKEVFTIEVRAALSREAESRLDKLGYKNIHFKIGDGTQGWPEYAPFDAIIVTAAPDRVPIELTRQLSPGGIMIIPVGEEHATQQLLSLKKTPAGIETTELLPVRFVPIVHEP
jgi:protein-L-isoaspartate(D-aspartate) O-methyltransferase